MGWKKKKRKGEQCLSTRGEEAAKYIISSKESRSDKQHLFVSGQQRMARDGMAWHGVEWHRMRHEEGEGEEERGCWKGISGWALTLGLFMLEKKRALSLLCRVYTQRAKGGLRFPPTPPPSHTTTPLADWETRKVQRCSCRQSPAKAFWCPSPFWGDRSKAWGLLDVVPRTTSEEAAVCKRRRIGPGIKDGWRRKESSVSKEGSHVIGVSQCL